MLPLLLAVKPLVNKRSGNVPIGKGNYLVKSNRIDSTFEFYLNDKSIPVTGDSIDIIENSIISLLFLVAGTEKSISLFLEKQ